MKDYFSYENNIIMVDLIVKSTNDLVPLVMKNTDIDSTISETITLILKFLEKILKLLPDLLSQDNPYNIKKQNTIETLSIVIEAWENFRNEPIDFRFAWDEFHHWWKEIHKDLLIIQRSSHTIYLSMN
jgi:hypothetical protein